MDAGVMPHFLVLVQLKKRNNLMIVELNKSDIF